MSEKYTLMQAEKARYPIARMARLLKVSTSGYYAWVAAQQRDGDHLLPSLRARRRLDEAVRRIWVDSRSTYGYLRVCAQLRREGVVVDRKTVAASMRRQGLAGISPRRFRPVTTIPGTRTHSIPDRVKRHWDTGQVDRVWVTGITYLRTRAGWVYLCAIKDACSRKVIATAMSTTMTTDLVEEALRRARIIRPNAPRKVIIHSDRGTQGEFNWSSQHLDRGGVQLWRRGTGPRRRAMCPRVRVGNGVRIGRCVRRCVRPGGLSPRGRCSGSSGV
ncbi:Integrase, catalytic region [Propionibacterium freudenreichii]|nr:Integrase, catalytic region [Propionibacterium freudenreichii]